MTIAVQPARVENPVLSIPWNRGDDPARLYFKEWLVTNGLGGYASGTVANTPTRRYHGIFVPDLPAPRGRTMMLPRLSEELRTDGKSLRLDGAQFVDGTEEGGQGALHLEEFRLDWHMPVWRYSWEGRILEKRIVMPAHQNTVYIQYALRSGEPVVLALRPFPTFRKHDTGFTAHADWPFTLTARRGEYEILCHDGALPLKIAVRPTGGEFVLSEKWDREILFSRERDRGYDHVEDQFSPGYFLIPLSAGRATSFIASTESWDRLCSEADSMVEAERRRLERLVQLAPPAARRGLPARLVIAADQFIVLPGSRPEETLLSESAGEHVKTVIAGYHWFTDWGRDTMIGLEGLTLCTGRKYEARDILRTFSHYVKDGLLPNLFPEGHRTAVYNTVDATFWYFHAIDRYLDRTGDDETLRFLYPTLQDIIRHHIHGTHFGIGMDPADGLMRAGEERYQLTWMDAKVGDWVVTPRRGKPVEIQALWYNALRLMAVWAQDMGEDNAPYETLARKVYESFNARFWRGAEQCLYDVVDGDPEEGTRLRPNMIFSVSLRFPVLAEDRWRPVVDKVAERLLTPYGLRSLDPAHKDYRSRYEGNLLARDAAYHQGLVWGWLIGPFIDAWLKVYHDKAKARRLLEGFESHLIEHGVGSVSEIFDADPPHRPRGCIAQAWSVAEVLRAYLATEPD